MSRARPISRAVIVALAFGLSAGCTGWDGPGRWLDRPFLAGLPASACAADNSVAARYPVEHTFDISFSRWSGSVRAHAVECIEHTDPLKLSKAAWVECRVTGPAVVTHAPSIDGANAFAAKSGAFELRANRTGLSCKPLN